MIPLEEPSAKAMLEGLLPRLMPEDVLPRFVVFEGKQDLEKQLGPRLRGWLAPDSVFIVLRDQDSGPCEPIKDRLVKICEMAGRPETVVRIACRELESWYFGDLAAVEKGLGIEGLVKYATKAKFREPDAIVTPSRELEKLTNGAYQKIAGSRSIGPHLSETENASRSFRAFIEGLRRIL